MLDLQVPRLSPCSSSVVVTMIQPRVIKRLPFLESGIDPRKHCLYRQADLCNGMNLVLGV